MNLIKKISVVACAFLLIAYLLLSRNLWLADLEKQVQIGNDLRTLPIDVSRPEIITWKIAGEDWQYNGQCPLSLVLDRVDTIPLPAFRRESMALKVRVDAYAIIYEPTGSGKVDGFRVNRLIKNFYYTTDTPLSPQARLWEMRGNSTIELGLAGVQRYPWEDTYISVEIIEADPVLTTAKPRLQIVGEHDFAVYHHIVPLRIGRDVVLLFLGSCVVALAYQALKRKRTGI